MTMNEKSRDFKNIPAAACTLVVGECEFGDNGEGAKSAPIKLTARSGKPIEHWFWGRVVHDLAGMHLHKSRIPIDYVHDSKEVLGYVNRFDTTSGDLIASGALVPFKDSDRATEIIHKSRQGVPYEASINFGGDGLKVQELMMGELAQVNGFTFEGPGIIVRDWPLRGIAICPYGADMNTDSSVLSNNSKVFSASVLPTPDAATKETAMSESVEVVAQAEAPKAVEDVKPVETPAAEAAPVVETPPAAVEAAQAEGEKKQEVKAPELSREEFIRIVDEFGADIAAQVVRDGGTYESALKLAYAKAQDEIKVLRATPPAAAVQAGQPVPVTQHKETKTGLFKTGK